MALTQMQIIQSLGEAMSWFERELAWGVPPTELRHLIGRIGELYAALISNGQMATEVNQKGYDVVGADGEKISVKTTAMMNSSGHIAFNLNTLNIVDKILILRINTAEMQIETLLFDKTENVIDLMNCTDDKRGKACISLSKLVTSVIPKSDVAAIKTVSKGNYIVKELENGTIEVYDKGKLVSPSKPVLRDLAEQLRISILNSNGNPYNTRQLGSLVIKTIEQNNQTLT